MPPLSEPPRIYPRGLFVCVATRHRLPTHHFFCLSINLSVFSLAPFHSAKTPFYFLTLPYPYRILALPVWGLRCSRLPLRCPLFAIGRLLLRIALRLCGMFCTRSQTPKVCPIRAKCGCSPYGVLLCCRYYVRQLDCRNEVSSVSRNIIRVAFMQVFSCKQPHFLFQNKDFYAIFA